MNIYINNNKTFSIFTYLSYPLTLTKFLEFFDLTHILPISPNYFLNL